MNNAELIESLRLLEREKGVNPETVITAIENSLLNACKNRFGSNDNITVHIDRETGDTELYSLRTVVENAADPALEISLENARKINPSYELGDSVRTDIPTDSFSRIATQTAKNIILQSIREEERRSVFDRYQSRDHDIVTGVVQRRNGRSISFNLGRADATMPEKEQIKTENYYPNARMKVLVLDVKDTPRGPYITVSRTHPDLVRRLFENEVAEIKNGVVEIKAIAREAGSRTKMAVKSNNPDVDPIGACIGLNGTRVNAVVNELNGEKIDIFEWSDNSAELIENALKPAGVIAILANDDDKEALVIVPDYQLSLAIGRQGQNARMAAKLTKYKIDIKSETEAREAGIFDEIGYIDDYGEEAQPEEGYVEEYKEEGSAQK